MRQVALSLLILASVARAQLSCLRECRSKEDCFEMGGPCFDCRPNLQGENICKFTFALFLCLKCDLDCLYFVYF